MTSSWMTLAEEASDVDIGKNELENSGTIPLVV